MPDVFSPRKRSEVMRQIRSKDTTPELNLRRLLHRTGYRYRLHVRGLPGKPDIVFPGRGAVIHVRGCFWHGHTCHDGHLPKSRLDYWAPKLRANKARDMRNDRKLRKMGWKVIVVWECRCQNEQSLRRELRRIGRLIGEPNHRSLLRQS